MNTQNIQLIVNVGGPNSVIEDATLEFKIKSYPYVIKELLKVISKELEKIK
jgi:hypothetical protein